MLYSRDKLMVSFYDKVFVAMRQAVDFEKVPTRNAAALPMLPLLPPMLLPPPPPPPASTPLRILAHSCCVSAAAAVPLQWARRKTWIIALSPEQPVVTPTATSAAARSAAVLCR